MKKFVQCILLIIFSISITSGQTVKEKKDPVGQWKFDAPYAPEGYTSGTIAVSLTENKYSVTMAFSGSDYQFNGNSIKVKNDSLLFSLYVEDQSVAISLKQDDISKMSGKAVYSEGVIPLTLTRVPKEETKQ